MQRLMITATLTTPILMRGGHLTFDGILASQLFDLMGDFEAAHDAIPIARTDGLFHASAAFFSETRPRSQALIIASLRARHDMRPGFLKQRSGRVHAKISSGTRSSFGAVSNLFTQINAEAVTWFVEGDHRSIADLILGSRRIYGIGARRNSGYGAVANWQIDDGPFDGVSSDDGLILRPIPIERRPTNRDLPVVDAAWRPAYWNPENRAACYVPERAL